MNPIPRKANRVEMNNNDHRGAKGGLRRLRRPRLLTCAAVLAIVAALPFAAGAAVSQTSLARPAGLQNFELKLNDSLRTITGNSSQPAPFSRTPSFAWIPVRGATSYELELATTNSFDANNSVVWSSDSLTTPITTPAASVPISLPWITGPSLFWRVRAIGPLGKSQWSNPRALVIRWTQLPKQLRGGPGYVRWSPVDGATGYQVWFLNAPGRKTFSTITNVADEREYYLPGKARPKTVEWRVRAERQVYGARANGLPATSFGPWSQVYTSHAPSVTGTAAYRLVNAVSDVVSTSSREPHTLVPGFTVDGGSTMGATFYRVYVYTDSDCVNRVFTGYPVASPAYAPRSNGGQVLPQGKQLMADGTEIQPTESVRSGSGPAKIDLWDNSGRYYAVAVPVRQNEKAPQGPPQVVTTVENHSSAGASKGATQSLSVSKSQVVKPKPTFSYQDIELPQDVCHAGHFITFRKSSSAPFVSSDGHPTATGLSPHGRLLEASETRSFYGSPLVTWTPAPGAVAYQVQWSKSADFGRSRSLRTAATSATLPLKPGSWWYRVRGINHSLPGDPMMTWSAEVPLAVTPPTFGVVGG
jgi:hypothetical protein